MKTSISYTLLAAAMACGLAHGQTTAFTTPVGYYNFNAAAGPNLAVPGFVNSASFAGKLVGAGAITLTVATGSITAGAFNAAGGFATHYVEITQAGSNQGVVIDIASNTNSIVTLASNITALSLTGTETITIRKHVTISTYHASAESLLSPFSDNVTIYNANGSSDTYYFLGAGAWSSDFVNPDGSNRPIPPGTGVIFNTAANVALTIVGEVKSSDVVVQLNGGGVINIVGPINPLVGSSALIKDLGFATMSPFSDNITLYPPGDLVSSLGTWYALGDGTVSTDFSTPSNATFSFTQGAIFAAATDTAFKVKSGL